MSVNRQKNCNWDIITDKERQINKKISWAGAQTAVLMDIRDELQKLNTTLNCPNFIRIPSTLDQIVRNTTTRK